MERRAFLLSVSFSLLAMYLVYQYIDGEEQALRKAYGTFYSMVVASRDILQYENIRPTDIEVIRVPAAMAPENRIEDPKDVVDAVAAIPITKGEHILDNKIISKNIYSGLDTQITQGRRGISIPVNPKSSVGYMLRPGNRVDIAAHFEYKTTGSSISEVKVFMQDLLVLASGRTIQTNPPPGVDQGLLRNIFSQLTPSKNRTDSVDAKEKFSEVRETFNYAKTDPSYQTVTLEVTPEQAQQLVYVMATFGESLILLLRHSDDRQLQRTPTMSLYDVMGEDSYLVKGNKAPPLKAIPRIRFYDYVGDQRMGVAQ